MRLKELLYLTIFFSACKREQSRVTLFYTRDFIIADTAVEANQFLYFQNYHSDYPIYYIGPALDTIKIGKSYMRGRTQWKDDFKILWNRKYSDKALHIFVDTAVKTNSPVEYFSDNPKIVMDSTINYSSFLFSIINISDSTIYLGRTFSVFFINREAKNKTGIG